MFSHMTVGTRDIEAAIAFYDRLLAPLGISRSGADVGEGWACWHRPGELAEFLVMRPIDGKAATVGNGSTVAFFAPDRPTVDVAYAGGLAAGGTDEGAPGPRPQYSGNYYGAYLRDPDGNKLCICHRDRS